MNTIHDLDETLIDFTAVRRRMLRVFLRDQTLDSDEREVLDAFDTEHDDLAAYRRRQIAAQAFERNGDTRRTRDAFRDAGHGLIDITAERNQRKANTKIVQLFPDQHNAG